MEDDRSWMYARLIDGFLSERFIAGVERFIEYAFSQPDIGNTMKCPCSRCGNTRLFNQDDIKIHLYKYGFIGGYTTWTEHGEHVNASSSNYGESSTAQGVGEYNLHTMVMDAMGPQMYNVSSNIGNSEPEEHIPNSKAANFFTLLQEVDKPLWPGCVKHPKLSEMSQLLNCKSEYNMPTACYDRLMSIVTDMLPENNLLESTFYKTKKMLSSLGLGVVKIDACINDCMLYYKETENLVQCTNCNSPRFKDAISRSGRRVAHKVLRYLPLTPRLQRLYMSRRIAEHMIWHANNAFTHEGMSHPVHGEAWKHFDRTYPEFFYEPRNVRLGLCTDGFNPFNMTSTHYSCWPVITTVYNLPPGLCMRRDNLFLTMVIPGPKSPGKDIDVYLRPLIDELKMLWDDGVETYDIHRRQNFTMKAALMWTISDFPGLGMLSGWSTHGPLCCPYCMDQQKSFRLKNGRKCCFFDCHRRFLPHNHPFRRQRDKFFKRRMEKDVHALIPPTAGEYLRGVVDSLPSFISGRTFRRSAIEGFGSRHNWIRRSIFWDLPYWHTNLIRHNLDVMHIEKNVFENIFNTVMDVKDKTKDNFNARKDLELYCNRPKLHIMENRGKLYKPKASYSLTKEQKLVVCNWMKTLRMPDGYASNIARCVKGTSDFYGMKSHDCHIFMQRLIPIAFKDVLPKPIWEALTELSNFFKDLCSTIVKVEDMKCLEKNIVVIICKLEKIFPPSFFDSMEHLPIHLPYEARVGGSVQYRWMYPFERFLNHLKRKVKNRASVEGSIVEAYLVEETSTFCSLYFEDDVQTRLNHPPRNDDGGLNDPLGRLSIFTYPGRPLGKQSGNSRELTDEEYRAASRYVLLNCEEVTTFVTEFERQMRINYPRSSDAQLDRMRDEYFGEWLRNNVLYDDKVDPRIKQLAQGPCRRVTCYNGYFVNGFKFHTSEYGQYKKTMNNGVCVLGSCYNELDRDYYGMLTEIVELVYFGSGNTITLFKCDWFDNEHGVHVDQQFNLVEVNHRRTLASPDCFVLAQQAQQVYYTSVASTRRDRQDWWAVVKTKARHLTQVEGVTSRDQEINFWVELAFQDDRSPYALPPVSDGLELDVQPLVHNDVYVEEVDSDEVTTDGTVDIEELAQDREGDSDTHEYEENTNTENVEEEDDY